MKKYKKMLVISSIIMNCFIMSSCFSYKDINRISFVTAMMIDVDDSGSPVIYAEAFKGTRGETGQGMDQRVLVKGKGKTIFEAARDMNAVSSYKLNYTQNKVILFTQKAAEFGVGDFIDFLDRDQEFLLRPYITIYTGDPEKLMTTDLIQEKYIGILIRQIIENIGASSRAVTLTFNDFYNQRLMGDKTNVVTIIDFKKDALEAKLEINGGAVIKKDKMISILAKQEGQGYNFLLNHTKSGTLEITNPCDINKFVTLEILKSKTKTEISYDGDIVHLKKKVKVKVDFGEAQKSIIFTKENINKIQEQSEENIVKACNILFEKYKGMGIDIFDIQEKFDEKYPKIKIQGDIINKTQLKVEVEVEIMNTGDVKNFQ